MGLKMCVCIWVCLVIYGVFAMQYTEGSDIVEGTVNINGKNVIGLTDSDFICATLDWWPPEKCDYGTCSWDHASLLNLVCLPPCTLLALYYVFCSAFTMFWSSDLMCVYVRKLVFCVIRISCFRVCLVVLFLLVLLS